MNEDHPPFQPGGALRLDPREQGRIAPMVDYDAVAVPQLVVIRPMGTDVDDAVGATGEEADRPVRAPGGQTPERAWNCRTAVSVHFTEIHQEARAELPLRQQSDQP